MKWLSKSKSGGLLVAQQTGTIVSIEEVPDEMFSGKILGNGMAIIPTENRVVAPVSGTVVQLAKTLHAVCLESDDGLEILIHLGLDTVKLNGKAFVSHVVIGQHVAAGDPLMDMDIELIKQEGLHTITPCIITNMDIVKQLTTFTGQASAGKTPVIQYSLQQESEGQT